MLSFIVLFCYLGIAGTFFGLIALAMTEPFWFKVYCLMIIPLLVFAKPIFKFSTAWMLMDSPFEDEK